MLELRAMNMSDLQGVVRVIDAYDDDDAESAQDDFQQFGVEGHYVLEREGRIVGITGFRENEACDRSYWLSWTYLEKSECGQGQGKKMLQDLLSILRERNARKVFVKVSSYKDDDGYQVYERAFQVYQALGFELGLTGVDFYDEGEDQRILGLNFESPSDEAPEVAEEKPVIRFNGLHEIAETEGAYTFEWIVQEKKGFFSKRSFSVEDLTIGLETVKGHGGRKVFLTFPSNLPLIHRPLQAAGFKYVGQLADYYERGVHEFHFTHDLTQI